MKRKIYLAGIIAVLVMVFGSCVAMAASGECGDNLTWTLDSQGTLTISGTGEMTSHPWTEGYSYDVEKVIVEEGVTTIMEWAFSNCFFTSIELPDSLTFIGEEAFRNCIMFTTIEIPENVEVISTRAFDCCYDLATVTILSPNIIIEDKAFVTCNDLETIRGYTYSSAERYAKRAGYTFESIGEVELKTLAEGEVADGITWTLDTHGLLTVEGNGIIPDYTQKTDVPWHEYREAITKVVLSNGITSVGEYAFYDCISLEEITLSDCLTRVGPRAFYNCKCLTKVELPITATEIGEYAFAECKNLESITVSYRTATFGNKAFGTSGLVTSKLVMKGYNNSLAQKYAQEESIAFESIGEAIDEVVVEKKINDNLTWSISSTGTLTLTGSGSMTGVGSYSQKPWASYNNYIEKIIISHGITWVDRDVFDCPDNCEITIPYSVLWIEKSLENAPKSVIIKGYSNSVAETAAIDNSLTFESLGEMPDEVVITGALGSLTWSLSTMGKLVISGEGRMPIAVTKPWENYINTIKQIVIEHGVTSISSNAFNACRQVETVTIDYSVTDISYNSFYGLTGITVYGYDETAAQSFAESNDFNFVSLGEPPREVIASGTCGESIVWEYDNRKTLTITGDGYMTGDTVPWESYNSKIKKVVIEGNIESIMAYAFAGTLIETIELPDSVVFIDYAAFEECSKLKQVITPFGMMVIGARAFYGCDNLETVGIPYSTIMIGGEAFDECPLLTIYGYEDHVSQRVAGIAEVGFVSLGEIGGEFGLYDNITDTCQWSLNNYGELVISGEGDMIDYTLDSYICPWYSGYGANVTDITIEKGITSIGDYAFFGCQSVENVQIGSSVLFIGEYAFAMNGFEEIALPNNLKSIGRGAFAACENLKSVWLPSAIKIIEPYTFSQCTDLKHIEIPKNLTGIGENAFLDTSLQYVYYKGTKSNWNTKVAGKNYIPENAIIKYSADLPEEIKVTVNSATKTSTGASVKVTLTLKGGEKVYIVGYDKDNAQVAIVSVDASGTYKLTGEVSKVKVLTWEDEYSMTPLTEVYVKNFG